MTSLEEFIKSKISIDNEVLRDVLSNFKKRIIKKGRFLLTKGQIANEYYFVDSGMLRIYSKNGDKQVTAWIAIENDFFAELYSLKKQEPTKFIIEAIEETTLLSIDKDSMEKLYALYPEWQKFGREIWELTFLKLIDWVASFQIMTAEERYLAIMNQPGLLNRIPLKDLASFLGITPTSLSRIRKTVK